MNEILKKNLNAKKTKITLAIGIGILLLVTFAATFAYFSVTAANNATATDAKGNAQSTGDLSLTTNTSNLYINLDGVFMSQANVGSKYFATTDTAGTPIASANATLGNGIYTLATASLTSGNTKYNCNYTYDISATVKTSITDNSDSDIKVKITGSSIANGSKEYTLKELLAGASTLTGNFNNLTSGTPQTITIESTVENTANPQDDFAGNNYTIILTPKAGKAGFSCEVVTPLDLGLLAEKLVADNTMWQSGLEEDGYRFTGSGNATASTTPNNFICFGTSDKTECKANENKYLYRIIGIFKDDAGVKHTKLIKYQALSREYEWHSSPPDIAWEASDLYKGLNGSYFLNNTTYNYLQNATWLNKIANWKWNAVNTRPDESSGPHYSDVTTKDMYLHEMNRTGKTSTIGTWTTPSAKIGLMYASDYQMSLGKSALNYTGSNYTTLKTGWMHITNNVATRPNEFEWTLSRCGAINGGHYAWSVSSDGYVGSNYVWSPYSVRPVFYLVSNARYDKGAGSYSDPITID